MEREDKIEALAMNLSNFLIENGNTTCEDIACAIAYLVGVVDNLSHKKHNASSGSFAKYVYDMIGAVHNVYSDQPNWRPSTTHPQMDVDVIALVGENNKICFAHIVDKDRCIGYDGWNIPGVRCWIPCPKINEN